MRAAAAAAVLVLAAGCGGGGGDGSSADGGGKASKSAEPTPSETAADPAAYKKALASAVAPLQAELRKVDGAKPGKPLESAVASAAEAARTAATALAGAEVPDDASAGHTGLVDAVRKLGDDLSAAGPQGTAADGSGGSSGCGSENPRVALDDAEGITGLKAATGQLETAGYPVELTAPRTEKPQNRRLANGAFVKDGSRGGLGQLKIDNGTESDTAVSLVRDGKAVFTVYVRASSATEVSRVADGTYEVYYTSGTDWDGGAKAFTRDCAFSKFDQSTQFTTVRSAAGTQYSVISFSLQKVLGGNATTSEVPPGDFPG